MVTVVRLPKFGEIMVNAIIDKWYKKEGDKVDEGEPLVQVETQKFTVDIEAPVSGILRKVIAAEGSVVAIGEPLGIIAGANEEVLDVAVISDLSEKKEVEKPPEIIMEEKQAKVSPRARRLAEEYSIDITTITGTGPEERIIEKDIQMAIEQMKTKPSVKGEANIIPLTGMRKTIAERLSYSARTAVHVTITTQVDTTELKKIREKLLLETKDANIRISFTDFVVKAVAEAIKRYPILNSTFEADHIKVWQNINIGVAVATKDGLVVPVIYNADKKSIIEIAAYSQDIIEKSRQMKITPSEATGSTFTITNLGMYDVDIFKPIINPPESAILGVGRMYERPVVIDGKIMIRSIMNLSLVFDHRVIDGAIAAQFLEEIKRKLENPKLLMEQEKNRLGSRGLQREG